MEKTVTDFREVAFDRYISYGFGEQNYGDLASVIRHYAYNYLHFLPQDRNATILDIGCGMGEFLCFLQKHGYTNFLGLDVGQEQVECSNKRLGVEKAVRVASTEDFLANGSRYSLIVMLSVIEHLKKETIVRLLEQVREALTDDGVLIVKTENIACLTGSFNRYLDFTHEVGFVEPSLKQVLRIAGFRKIQFMEEKLAPPYSFKTQLWLFLVHLYRKGLRLAYEFERRGNFMPATWGKDLTAIAWK
jgi:SAM-dependent methyltransferase